MHGYPGLLLAITILTWAGLLFLIWRWPQGKAHTFSQHAAMGGRASMLYYALLFSVVLPALLVFYFQWLIPVYKLSGYFAGFAIASVVTQFICITVPELKGWRFHVHRGAAAISALCLLPQLAILLRSSLVAGSAKVVIVASILTMLVIYLLLIVGKGYHKLFLILQSSYYAAFFAALLAVTYMPK